MMEEILWAFENDALLQLASYGVFFDLVLKSLG